MAKMATKVNQGDPEVMAQAAQAIVDILEVCSMQDYSEETTRLALTSFTKITYDWAEGPVDPANVTTHIHGAPGGRSR